MSDQLSNGLKQIMLAGIGAMAVTVEKSKELVEELVKKGELTVEQGKVVNEELKRSKNDTQEKTDKTSTHGKEMTEKAVPQGSEKAEMNAAQGRQADLFAQVESLSKEDREKLREKLNQLNEEG